MPQRVTGQSGRAGQDGPPAPQLRLASGIRTLEARLLAALRQEQVRTRAEPARLAAPLRIVVPSNSLRLHLGERIAHELGAVLGVQLQTLGALAREVLERAGARAAATTAHALQVRREAQREPALAGELAGFDDAWAPVVAAVDDLIDAGFEPAHAAALLERIDALRIGVDAAERARALVRVAARTGEALDAGHVGHRSRWLADARAVLERDPTRLPARAVWLHGFSDATGVQTDLIEALMRGLAARVWLDEPRDPGQRGAPPLRGGFGAGLRARLHAAAREHARDEQVAGAGALRLLSAPDRGAEVRAVAERVARAIDAGVAPERIALVARDLAPYRLLLRAQLRRLAVPFSGLDEPGAATPARRRLTALLALLAQAGETPSDLWLDALAQVRTRAGALAPLAPPHRADLRDALHASGRLRLAGVAALMDAPPERDVELAARRGLRAATQERPARVARRRVAPEALTALARSAVAALACCEARPARAAFARHRRWLEDLVRELGWRADAPGRVELAAALRELEPIADLELERAEFGWLLERELAVRGWSPLGGAGGGVQLLSVMEARARSFEQLFVLGLSRGAFPRNVSEDALLPDALRQRLREVLPDLPVKREGFDEERFLFAQLLSAAPEVTLSHALRDEDGRPVPRSPLLESLLRCHPSLQVERVPSLHAPERGPAGALESPGERALRLALHGARDGLEPVLRHALEAAGTPRRAGVEAAALARARLAVLHEQDGYRNDPGPYFGFVGAPALPADLRRGEVFVTTFERLAGCPWQAFLMSLLRLAARRDGAAELPSARDPRLLGNVVHAGLEEIAGTSGGELSERRDEPPRHPDWPDPAALEAILRGAAESCLREAGVAVPGFAAALAARARPLVERVRQLDWSSGPPAVLAAELHASAPVAVAGATRSLRLKADRVDRVGDALRFTDYKTGKPIAAQVQPARRDAALQQEIACGGSLQAMAYARAGGDGAEGRYLQLHENAPDVAAVLAVCDEPPWSGIFDETLARLFGAWDAGSFPPRLLDAATGNEPGRCRYCDVKQACLRGDSGARRRLARFAQPASADDGPLVAARALYHLGREPA